ncbi:PREDICTED: protein MGARP-like [Miniopterus natalensis]|uniref:protein MGARP-like n=1 Tax=Miniopterus natalensis TaxID=291302 RepID=UPI0007A6DF13|nr:PREDICTED: protein MGARP-like [Miniopterus natalensis]
MVHEKVHQECVDERATNIANKFSGCFSLQSSHEDYKRRPSKGTERRLQVTYQEKSQGATALSHKVQRSPDKNCSLGPNGADFEPEPEPANLLWVDELNLFLWFAQEVTITVGAETWPELPNIATNNTTKLSTKKTSEVMDAALYEGIAINKNGTTESESSGAHAELEQNSPTESECTAGYDLQEEASVGAELTSAQG